MSSVSMAVGAVPAASRALESAPGPNLFGLLIVGLLVVAAGVAVWASLRDRRARGSRWNGRRGPRSAAARSASPAGRQGRRPAQGPRS